MKKIKLIGMVVGIAIFLFSSAHAALFTIEIDDTVPLTEIQSFQIIFDVSSDFTFNSGSFAYGSAIDTSGTMGWDHMNKLENSSLTISGGDRDGMFMLDYHDLMTGILATFDYTGTIEGVDEAGLQFSNHAGINQWSSLKALGVTYSINSNSLVFSSVPVPSSLLLLGGGICALMGIVRRKMNSN